MENLFIYTRIQNIIIEKGIKYLSSNISDYNVAMVVIIMHYYSSTLHNAFIFSESILINYMDEMKLFDDYSILYIIFNIVIYENIFSIKKKKLY